ncbi:MAG: ABC transporter permease subunit, partial [Methanomassiliicoccales archaeon]
DKVWTVARKDISEFRTNRYIMVSLVLMPLFFSIFIPIAYLMPVAALDTGPDDPLHLDLDIQEGKDNFTISNHTLRDMRLVDCTINDSLVIGSYLENCSLNNVLVKGSYIGNGSLEGSLVVESNLLGNDMTGTRLVDSADLGRSDGERLVTQFIDGLLMFFVLIPVALPTLIASYSFVGEKLNRSLEPLLATPTTDLELLMGKALSIFLPTMLVTWLALIPFVSLVDILAEPILGYFPLPDLNFTLGVFLLAPLVCLLSIFANVIVSSRVSDVRASQQIGGLIVLPVVAFFVIILTGLVSLSVVNMLLFIGLMFAADLVVIHGSLRVFQREEILVRWR